MPVPFETFMKACKDGDLDVVRAEATHQALRRFNLYNNTPLMTAAANGRTACVDVLLPLSNPDQRSPDGYTALMFAVGAGHLACVERLLPVSDPDQRNPRQQTLLMIAAKSNQPACVKALLPVSDLRATDREGFTALTLAQAFPARRTELAAVIALLENAELTTLPLPPADEAQDRPHHRPRL